jgi:hypothetical protein
MTVNRKMTPKGPTVATETTDLREILAELAEEAALLSLALDGAVAIQWSASPVPRPREDTTERSKGAPPSDPTGDVALEERRLAVRAAVEDGARSLRVATAMVSAAASRVSREVDAWEGR